MKVWIHIGGVQEGPFELDRLPLQRMRPDTPVWHEGLDYWKEACQVPEVAVMLANRPAPAQEPWPAQEPAPAQEPEPAPAEEPVVSEPDVTVELETETNSVTVETDGATGADAPAEQVSADAAEAAGIAREEAETVENMRRASQAATPEPGPQTCDRQPYAQQPCHGQPQQPYYGQPQQPYYGQYGNAMPMAGHADSEEEYKPAPTYILWAVLVTLLCCCPVGVAAIATSLVTSRRNSNYDYKGARRMSEATEWLIIISMVLALISAPFSFLVML